MIASHAVNKIADGDVVLTYAHSGVVLASLLEAHRLGRRFRVVVVNSRPLNEGRKTLTTLLEAGLSCQYIHLNALVRPPCGARAQREGLDSRFRARSVCCGSSPRES
jgi:translation initiation factor 2B subunit (eIF-2B alpha/beta/delta family)